MNTEPRLPHGNNGDTTQVQPDYADENVPSSMLDLLTLIDVQLSPELLQIINDLKATLAETSANPDKIKQLWTEYALQFEALAEQEPNGDKYATIQIAAILQKALIFRNVGNTLRYATELDSADIYALNTGLNELSDVLGNEIELLVGMLDESPESIILRLRGIVSDMNREYLRDLWIEEQDYEDFVNYLYGILTEEGLDAEEVLKELGIIEA